MTLKDLPDHSTMPIAELVFFWQREDQNAVERRGCEPIYWPVDADKFQALRCIRKTLAARNDPRVAQLPPEQPARG
jgi:hypothetical protein